MQRQGSRKDRVQMGPGNDRIAAGAVVRRDHVADRIRCRTQTVFQQLFPESLGSRELPEWRRGDFGEPDLIGFNFGLVLGNEVKSALDTGVREHTVNVVAHYRISKVTASDSI